MVFWNFKGINILEKHYWVIYHLVFIKYSFLIVAKNLFFSVYDITLKEKFNGMPKLSVYVIFITYCKMLFFLFPKKRKAKVSFLSRTKLLLIRGIFKNIFFTFHILYDIPLDSVLFINGWLFPVSSFIGVCWLNTLW